MVLEQVLTIIFAVGIGAAVIVYAARPRHRGVSISVGPSALGSFSPAEAVQAAPMPQVAAVETPVVETYPPEVHAPVVVAPVVEEVAAVPVEVAPAATPVTEASPPVPAPTAETVGSHVHAAPRTRRAQRKRSTSTKSRARSARKKSETRPE